MRRTMQCEMPDPMSAPGTHRPFAPRQKFVRFRGQSCRTDKVMRTRAVDPKGTLPLWDRQTGCIMQGAGFGEIANGQCSAACGVRFHGRARR